MVLFTVRPIAVRRSQPVVPREYTLIGSDSIEIPKTLWSDQPSPETNPIIFELCANLPNEMDSYCLPPRYTLRQPYSYANPDVVTSAGLVADAYSQFKVTFWIDRALVWLTVLIPISNAALLLLLHMVNGVARCIPREELHHPTNKNGQYTGDFVDRACGLQLTADVLKGHRSHVNIKGQNDIGILQLQHECYPFLLLVFAVLMWIPHFIHLRAVDKTARRDLCLVRSEMHSFRRAVGKELNYMRAMSVISVDNAAAAQNRTFLSPSSTIPGAPNIQQHLRYQSAHAPGVAPDADSGLTTAATAGGTSFLSQTPAPTVIRAQPHPSETIPTTQPGIPDSSHAAVPLSLADADFSAPGLADLPCFHACHADWSLNAYLSAWQNTDFYWRLYLTKHVVLATLQMLTLTILFILIGLSRGVLFSSLFDCKLDSSVGSTVVQSVCILQSTFMLNMSALIWSILLVTGVCLQGIYFYANFIRSFLGNDGQYFGVTNRPTTFVIGLDETGRCFFADYIRLLAYTAFRDTQSEIRSLSVSYSPMLYRSDFHFISLLCSENANLFPDAIHIHFWTERYARLCRRRFRQPFWAIRRGSLGHLVRCEDLSMKFNFSKIRIKVEVNDFGG